MPIAIHSFVQMLIRPLWSSQFYLKMNYNMKKSNFSIIFLGRIYLTYNSRGAWHTVYAMLLSNFKWYDARHRAATIATMKLQTGELTTVVECFVGDVT